MNISNSELEVMKVLWVRSPLTVGQIIERVQKANGWHDNTIKTMLLRLNKKQAVGRHKDGGRFFYEPLVSRESFLTEESEGLLQRLFGGQMAPLIAHFADREKLSKKDIDDIEAILRDLKKRSD